MAAGESLAGSGIEVSPGRTRTVIVRGDKVAELRIKKGWSVAELARKARMSKPTIKDMEAGKRPQFESTLIRVAKALGIEDIRELRADTPKAGESSATEF